LLRYVRPYWFILIISLVLVAIVGILEAASTFLIGSVFGALGSNASAALPLPFVQFVPEDIRVLLVLLIGATIVKVVAEYGATIGTAYLGNGAVRDLRNDVFGRIVSQPIAFFERNPTGELISRVSADVERIQTAASETLADFLKQAAIFVFLLATIFLIDWK